jgi:hypothetical protein
MANISTIHIFRKGTEDIFYDRMEGDIIVNYYLMCEVDNNDTVLKAFSFAYGGGCGNDGDYFDLEEDEKIRRQIKTLDDAKKFNVAEHVPANRENECGPERFMKESEEDPFYKKWMELHRVDYYWLYEKDE